MCEMVCQIVQKKQEEKRIEEEQAANARYWKIPACCDDDDDYNSAITPVLSTEKPVDSLSMGDEHLDTILVTLAVTNHHCLHSTTAATVTLSTAAPSPSTHRYCHHLHHYRTHLSRHCLQHHLHHPSRRHHLCHRYTKLLPSTLPPSQSNRLNTIIITMLPSWQSPSAAKEGFYFSGWFIHSK
nr:hypothetical protein [Tanacetum cinerariifolium]